MKVIPACKIIILPCFLVILFGLIANNAFAVTYQIPVDVSFTFNSTATLSISGDLVIENLTPGNSSDSNIITISASSNNIVGYDIEATVGDSTNNYTDLRISSSDSTNVFTSLSSNVSALNSFSNDKWGYSYSTDNGTTWVSGNTGSTNTGYNGLPLYTSTGVKLADTSAAGSSTIKFKIGAKASSSKVSGDYTNIINFILTSKVLTTNYTLNYLPNDGNNGQDVSDMPNPATVSNTITDDTNYTLSNSTPARDGYTFLGWCDGTVTTTSNVDSCGGTTYQPEDTYLIRNVGDAITINLNAMWESLSETWYFNETPECPTGADYYHINFNSNQESFSILKCQIGINYSLTYDNQVAYYWVDTSYQTKGHGGGEQPPAPDPPIYPVWVNQAYRTIVITGGDDMNDPDFRAWLSDNATQL